MALLDSSETNVCFMHPSVGATGVSLALGAPFVIGRSGAQVDLTLDWDNRVSRRHARLIARADGVWFEDLGSRNGSWVGDTRLSGLVKLVPGMEILVGETVLALDDGRLMARRMTTKARAVTVVEPTGDLRNDAPAPKPRVQAIDAHLRRFLANSTADLPPTVAAETETPNVPAARRLRHMPEVVREGAILVRVSSPDELAELWERELSHGSLFVPTNALLPLDTVLDVEIVSPHGAVVLAAKVAARVGATSSARSGRPMGMRLALTDLNNATRRVLRDYAEGLVARLSVAGAAVDDPQPTVDERVRLAADLVTSVAAGDVYGALGLAPIAPTVELRARLSSLESLFELEDDEVAEDSVYQVFAAAHDALDRLRSTVGDEQRRLAYDLRAGHVRAEERLALAKTGLGPSAIVLREAWERAWPAQADRAAFLARLAFAHRAKGKLSVAIDAAESALQFHPFYDELRITLRAWTKELAERRAQAAEHKRADPEARS